MLNEIFTENRIEDLQEKASLNSQNIALQKITSNYRR